MFVGRPRSPYSALATSTKAVLAISENSLKPIPYLSRIRATGFRATRKAPIICCCISSRIGRKYILSLLYFQAYILGWEKIPKLCHGCDTAAIGIFKCLGDIFLLYFVLPRVRHNAHHLAFTSDSARIRTAWSRPFRRIRQNLSFSIRCQSPSRRAPGCGPLLRLWSWTTVCPSVRISCLLADHHQAQLAALFLSNGSPLF